MTGNECKGINFSDLPSKCFTEITEKEFVDEGGDKDESMWTPYCLKTRQNQFLMLLGGIGLMAYLLTSNNKKEITV